ncbi:MAG: type IX secretion system sortase PorU [Fidelibacterota bacterium]
MTDTNRIKSFILIFLLFTTFTPLTAYQTHILTETESGLHFRVADDSKIEWRRADAYPDSISMFFLGAADIVDINPVLAIPYWSFLLALPTPHEPATIRTFNVTSEIIQLEKSLIDEHIKQINARPLWDVIEVGYLRFNPVCELVIYPLKVVDSRHIRIIRSVEVSVSYAHKSSENTVHSSSMKAPAKSAFINSKYLKTWQQRPQRQLAKRASYPAGTWFRITVKKDGIYAISHQDLVAAGLPNQTIENERIFLYSNGTGGRAIDNTPGITVLDNLVENTRRISGSNDGTFHTGDAIIFYGRATSGVDADINGRLYFNRHAYSDVNYYWLLIAEDTGQPKSMPVLDMSTAIPDTAVLKYERIDRHELDMTNFLRSGTDWYGEKFASPGANISVVFQLPEKADEDPETFQYPANLSLKTRGTTNSTAHTYKIFLNNSPSPVASWTTSNWYVSSRNLSISLKPGIPNIIKLHYSANVSSASAHIDFVQIRYEAPLKPRGDELDFWGPARSGIVEYRLSDIGFSEAILYDITDWNNVTYYNLPPTAGHSFSFKTQNQLSQRSHYLLTHNSKYLSADNIIAIQQPEWTTLRRPENAAQYVIITDEPFKDAAQELANLYSEEVKSSDRLSSLVVLQSQILREFNADIVDPHAIRQFLSYALNNWAVPPEYVLLFGDGTFDYRHIESKTGNHVMTYQVEGTTGNSGFNSYATDMRFAYAIGQDRKMDVAIGRINIRSSAEAQAVADKIRSYVLEPIYGDWRSTITLVADDPVRPNTNEQEHITDTENKIANYLPKSIDIKKLYLLEYPEIQDATTYGVKKPDATDAILKQLEDGTTIINYFGHGSPTVWAQEYILEMNRDLRRINTGMKLPLWIAGTCSWGQFDDIQGSCFPEALVIEPNDGGIAALAASRATYPGPNAFFVNQWMTNLFNDKSANRLRLGEVLQIISGLAGGLNENNEKYILFGDPALYLALPYHDIELSSLPSDTLKTLSNVAVRAKVDNSLTNFSGAGILKIYDSDRRVTRFYLDGNRKEQSLSYTLPGEILFAGLVDIQNSQFSSRFYIPKDLNYAGLSGKITAVGWSEETGTTVGGYYAPIYYSGAEAVFDTTGPAIEIGIVNQDFKNGDILIPDNQLEIRICDPIGINIAGKLGHDITLVFDGDQHQAYIVTEYFTYDTNSDSSGSVVYPLPVLSPGSHSVTVTAWDNNNNPSSGKADFTLLPSADFALEKVVNFPNPFAHTTDITFHLTQPATISCTIYTVRGLKIRTLESEQLFLPGFNMLHWDGVDDFGSGVAKGIYIYKINARSVNSNAKDAYIGKMVKAG